MPARSAALTVYAGSRKAAEELATRVLIDEMGMLGLAIGGATVHGGVADTSQTDYRCCAPRRFGRGDTHLPSGTAIGPHD